MQSLISVGSARVITPKQAKYVQNRSVDSLCVGLQARRALKTTIYTEAGRAGIRGPAGRQVATAAICAEDQSTW